MVERTLAPQKTQQETLVAMTTACLLGSWQEVPLRMGGHRMATVTIVQAVILIGQTDHSSISPLTWSCGLNDF